MSSSVDCSNQEMLLSSRRIPWCLGSHGHIFIVIIVTYKATFGIACYEVWFQRLGLASGHDMQFPQLPRAAAASKQYGFHDSSDKCLLG